jgi:hypothetical protein
LLPKDVFITLKLSHHSDNELINNADLKEKKSIYPMCSPTINMKISYNLKQCGTKKKNNLLLHEWHKIFDNQTPN